MPTHSPHVLCVRLTQEEYDAFIAFADLHQVTRSTLLRKAIREMINAPMPDLLQEEQILVRVVIRYLAGISNNLNQIARHMNSGMSHSQRVDVHYLNDIYQRVQAVKEEFRQYLTFTRKRLVL